MASVLFKQCVAFAGAAAVGGLLFGLLPIKFQQWKAEAASESVKAGAGLGKKGGSGLSGGTSRAATGAGSAVAGGAKASGGAFAAEINKLLEGPEDARLEQMDGAMARWVEADLTAAREFVESLPAGENRRLLAGIFMECWAAKDPRGAAAWLGPKLGTGQWLSCVGALCAEWASQDPKAAAAWAGQLVEPSESRTGVESIALAWGEKAPLEAVSWMEGLPAQDQAVAAEQIIGGWSERVPEEAANWLAGAVGRNPNLPASLGGGLVSSWVGKDAGGASRWLNNLPDGPLYEIAATVFAQSAAEVDPKSALPWAKTLTNTETRRHAVVHVMEEWLTNDRNGMLAALPNELENADEVTRQAVYDMLYTKDPEFRKNMLQLADDPAQ